MEEVPVPAKRSFDANPDRIAAIKAQFDEATRQLSIHSDRQMELIRERNVAYRAYALELIDARNPVVAMWIKTMGLGVEILRKEIGGADADFPMNTIGSIDRIEMDIDGLLQSMVQYIIYPDLPFIPRTFSGSSGITRGFL